MDRGKVSLSLIDSPTSSTNLSSSPSSPREDIAMTHTADDDRDMERMGKKQEFRRNFNALTSIAFTSCVMGTWEILLTSNTSALIAGGLSGLWWQFVWCYVGQTFVVLSLSEMSSMAPTAGGQYHFVSEFAPQSLQKALSYISGWLSILAWQSFVTVDSYICATMLEALVILNCPGYEPQRWQTTLIMIAIVLCIGAFNIFLAERLAFVEGVFAVLHFLAWIPVVVVLWSMTDPKQDARAVFTDFTGDDDPLAIGSDSPWSAKINPDNGAGWSSIALTVCIGQVGAMFTVVGSDAAAHTEEIRDASVTVPRSMWWAFAINIPVALIVLVTYLFCIPSIPLVLSDPTGYPVVAVFVSSTRSVAGGTALAALLLTLLFIIAISCMASTVRQTFAFARDNGMILSHWISIVDTRFAVPANAVVFTMAFSVAMSLINIGSLTAFNAFLSVSVVALMATYTISIACVLHRRLRGLPLPHARWKLIGRNAPHAMSRNSGEGGLGRYGPLVNTLALVYSVWAIFWGFWPIKNHPVAATMNWAVVIFAGAMTIAAIMFCSHGRKVYAGPVSTVRKSNDEI